MRAHDCLRTTYLLVTVWTPSWGMKAQIYRGYYIPFLMLRGVNSVESFAFTALKCLLVSFSRLDDGRMCLQA